MTFQVADHFDISQKISKADMRDMEAEMVLLAWKMQMDPESPMVKRQVLEMYQAVQAHNKALANKYPDIKRFDEDLDRYVAYRFDYENDEYVETRISNPITVHIKQ